MKLVLHPGHSKCGSTTIQRAIIKNRGLLESRDYIIPDPQMRTNGDDGFNPNGETPRAFFRHAMEQKDLEPLKDKLERIREKYGGTRRTILISAENLVNQLGSPAGLNIHKLLRDYFDSHNVIYYIRRQDQFIMSAWQQWGYKKGLSLQDFVEKALKGKNPNYRVIANTFGNIYGKDNVTIAPLLRDSLLEGDLVSDFFARLGMREKVQKPKESIDNKSLNPYLCEALSKVSHVFHDIHDESIKHQLEKTYPSDEALYMRADNYMTTNVRRRIHDFFESDNHAISVEHSMGTAWFQYSEMTSCHVDRERQAEQGALRIIDDLNESLSLQREPQGAINKNVEVWPVRKSTLAVEFPVNHMLVSKGLQEIEPAVRVLHLSNAEVCLKPAKAFSLNGVSVKELSTLEGERYLKKRRGSLQKFSGRILDLTTPGSNLYSHWLLDLLPKIKAVKEAGYDVTYDFDKVIVNFYGSRFKRESFQLLGIDDCLVSDYTNHVKCFIAEEVVSVTPCRHALYTPEWVLGFINKLFAGGESKEMPSKVYISRSKGNARRILDEALFVEKISALGYKTYYCEDHSVRTTAAVIRNATHIIAPHGAGLANIVFATPRTKIYELFCAHISPEFYKLSLLKGLNYHAIQVPGAYGEMIDVTSMDYASSRERYHSMNMLSSSVNLGLLL